MHIRIERFELVSDFGFRHSDLNHHASVLDRKLLREVRSSGSLLIAITSVIAVGVMCFIYMKSAYYNLDLAKSQYYPKCRMADFWVEVKKVPLAELDLVAEPAGRHRDSAADPVLRHGRSGKRAGAAQRRRPVSCPTGASRSSTTSSSSAAATSPTRRENEVIVNDAFAREHKSHPGEWIHLILNNRRQELFVVGTAISCEFVYLVSPGTIAPDPKQFGVFYLKQTFAEEVFDMDGACNQLVGTLAPSSVRERPDEVLRRSRRVLAPYGVFTTIAAQQPALEPLSQRRDPRPGRVRNIMPTIFLGRRGAGAQRAHGPADRPAADAHRHAQGPRLYRPPNLLALHQVRPGDWRSPAGWSGCVPATAWRSW